MEGAKHEITFNKKSQTSCCWHCVYICLFLVSLRSRPVFGAVLTRESLSLLQLDNENRRKLYLDGLVYGQHKVPLFIATLGKCWYMGRQCSICAVSGINDPRR